jgi:hypothetical protein
MAIFFITNIFAPVKEKEICYDIKKIQEKIDKKEILTPSEMQFYANYKGTLAQKTHVLASIFLIDIV